MQIGGRTFRMHLCTLKVRPPICTSPICIGWAGFVSYDQNGKSVSLPDYSPAISYRSHKLTVKFAVQLKGREACVIFFSQLVQ